MSSFIGGGTPHQPEFVPFAGNKTPEVVIRTEDAAGDATQRVTIKKLPEAPSTLPIVLLKDDKGYVAAINVHKTALNAKPEALTQDGPHDELTAHQAATGLSAMSKGNPDLLSGRQLSPTEIKGLVESILRSSYGNAAVDKSLALPRANNGARTTRSARLPSEPKAKLANSGHSEASVANTFDIVFGLKQK